MEKLKKSWYELHGKNKQINNSWGIRWYELFCRVE